jgi:hypothetical protein
MRPDELERQLRARLDALGPDPRAELLHVLMLPDLDRADAIGSYWGNPKTRTFAELLIDCEEDRTLRAVLVGMLRDAALRQLTPRRGSTSFRGGTSSQIPRSACSSPVPSTPTSSPCLRAGIPR